MTFLFIIPGIPAALGNFILPLMLGAKDVAFPRLNLASWYLYVFGLAASLRLVILLGGVDTGWTFYTPYSTRRRTPRSSPITAGRVHPGFSSIFTGLNFIVTIHKMRPRHDLVPMPLFLWALYATAIIQVLATPVLGITLLLLIAERAFGSASSTRASGGDPVLFQHFFWFYSHPAVYIMILPAMGIISELISTTAASTSSATGHRLAASPSPSSASSSGATTCSPAASRAREHDLQRLLTFSVSIPSAIKVFNWLATMYKGSIALTRP
jgi:cytochrome c oxidase subunit 1